MTCLRRCLAALLLVGLALSTHTAQAQGMPDGRFTEAIALFFKENLLDD